MGQIQQLLKITALASKSYILMQSNEDIPIVPMPIKKNHICQFCRIQFPPEIQLPAFMMHVRNCPEKKKKVLTKTKSKKMLQSQYIFEKVPIDETMTKFKWVKSKKINEEQIIKKQVKQGEDIKKIYKQLRKQQFQVKYQGFRTKLQQLRKNWTQGADCMIIRKSNLLVDSLNQLKTVDIHKEIKINFEEDKVSDAGGLLREWIHMIIQQIFSFQLGIFSINSTSQGIVYRLMWDGEVDQQIAKQWLTLLGVVFGKDIFQRIPITSYLDRTILRQLTSQTLKIQDIYGYDEQLYKSWSFLKNASQKQIQDAQIYFVYHHAFGEQMINLQLLPGGTQIKVTKQNIELYLDLCFQIIIIDKVGKSVKYIKEGLGKVFPVQLLEIFQPYQLEMIIYGHPHLDLQDWKKNTEYKAPYQKNHKIIKWFWKVMEQFDQEQLQRVLKFCTGSTRTPITGFSKLQSNRGNYSKFIIVSAEFTIQNPYPKGFTCFNRLQLPLYRNQEQLRTHLMAISKNDLDGVFGLD